MGWRKAPVVWLIVALNFLMLVYTSFSGVEAQQGLEDLMRKSYFVSTQGRLYAQYLATQRPQEYPEFLLELGRQVRGGQFERAETLGQLAFRDFNFLNAADNLDFDGDQVAFQLWRRRLADVQMYEESHPSFTLGLSATDDSLSKWISYIFVHSGAMHFVGNMIFLMIFGAALETQIGGLAMLVMFLLGGAFAAGVFALMTGVTSSPLVGASGAISGIMAMYCVLNWNKPTRYFYWFFLPLRGFMGLVYLPAWVALGLWGASDLAGYLGTLPELGGVAHTAHLGGEVAGALAALCVLTFRRWYPLPAAAQPLTPKLPMGVLIPFLPPKPTTAKTA
jgi:membrane associated rhomboid family serine protease